jgi:phosphoribosylamine--glycine ligase
MMGDRKFGDSGARIVIGSMTGLSDGLAFTDGKTIVPMLSSQDTRAPLTTTKGQTPAGRARSSQSQYTTVIAETA